MGQPLWSFLSMAWCDMQEAKRSAQGHSSGPRSPRSGWFNIHLSWQSHLPPKTSPFRKPTLGCHSRRAWLAFQSPAFESKLQSMRRCKLNEASPSIWRLRKEQHVRVSYADLQKATNGFSPENLIGAGRFGSVYKGNMDNNDNNIIAVKVLNLQQHGASKSFELECKALRSVRQRNIVKVLTACSSIDYAGHDFKTLVFEFMPNGSLDKWLHPQLSDGGGNITCLNLIQRLSIVVDVVCALEYLHERGSVQIIHYDMKPDNILLDEDMVAHIGDFGLANLLTEATTEPSQEGSIGSVALKGTIGYVAPGDVYSFGILLLEIFTGRRPTDEIFKRSYSLHQFVQMALPEHVMSIIDPKKFSLRGDEEVDNEFQLHINNRSTHELECIVSMLNVGLLCSEELPLKRIEIGQAFKELHAIKDAFHNLNKLHIKEVSVYKIK